MHVHLFLATSDTMTITLDAVNPYLGWRGQLILSYGVVLNIYRVSFARRVGTSRGRAPPLPSSRNPWEYVYGL